LILKYITSVNGHTYEIEINQNGRLTVDGVERLVDFQAMQSSLYSLLLDHTSVEALVEERDGLLHVQLLGDLYEVTVVDERERRLNAASSGFSVDQGEITIKSPMPGMIVSMLVAPGQEVEAGESLVVLESMKMENQIKAPRAGTIGHVNVAAGERVEQNKPLLTLI
jgi:biotin carboxyl carrier protein